MFSLTSRPTCASSVCLRGFNGIIFLVLSLKSETYQRVKDSGRIVVTSGEVTLKWLFLEVISMNFPIELNNLYTTWRLVHSFIDIYNYIYKSHFTRALSLAASLATWVLFWKSTRRAAMPTPSGTTKAVALTLSSGQLVPGSFRGKCHYIWLHMVVLCCTSFPTSNIIHVHPCVMCGIAAGIC